MVGFASLTIYPRPPPSAGSANRSMQKISALLEMEIIEGDVRLVEIDMRGNEVAEVYILPEELPALLRALLALHLTPPALDTATPSDNEAAIRK